MQVRRFAQNVLCGYDKIRIQKDRQTPTIATPNVAVSTNNNVIRSPHDHDHQIEGKIDTRSLFGYTLQKLKVEKNR